MYLADIKLRVMRLNQLFFLLMITKHTCENSLDLLALPKIQ